MALQFSRTLRVLRVHSTSLSRFRVRGESTTALESLRHTRWLSTSIPRRAALAPAVADESVEEADVTPKPAPADAEPNLEVADPLPQPRRLDASSLVDRPKVPEIDASERDALPFSHLRDKISYDTLQAITVKPMKLTNMTPVQEAVLSMLPHIAEPYKSDEGDVVKDDELSPRARDLMVRAKTGTGKTLAFLIPAIEARLKAIEHAGKKALRDAGLTSDKSLQAKAEKIHARTKVGTLILSPTRELATQIANEAIKLSYHHDGFEVRLLTGGVSKRNQMRDWVRGRLDIVVSTTGRLRDLMQSEPELVDALKATQILILDEADTMLDMGFREDIDAISEVLPPAPERQTFLFSATVNKSVEQVARRILHKNHVYLNTVPSDDSPVHAHVPQFHTVLPSAAEQLPHTLRILAHDQLLNAGHSKQIVFLPTTRMTQLYATLLRDITKKVLPAGQNTYVYEIHSRKTMEARVRTSDDFRKDKSGAAILVTSDVSARGVDYPGVSRVIQIGIPASTDQYIHRVGRTGRKGGVAGRGDLVLSPWEVGFLTWQLQDVPLKPVTTNEFKKQLLELGKKFDENPDSFFKGIAAPKTSRPTNTRDRSAPMTFSGPVVKHLEAIDDEVRELISVIDHEAVRETFASLLGYFISKSPELRLQKNVILEGLRDWSMQAAGLEEVPYVSEAYLSKLGFNDGRTKRFGRPGASSDRSQRSGASWEGRGRVRGRDEREERGRSGWNDSKPRPSRFARDDPEGDPSEYKTSRYGDTPSYKTNYDSPRRSFNDRGGSFNDRKGGFNDRYSNSRRDGDMEDRPRRSFSGSSRPETSYGFRR